MTNSMFNTKRLYEEDPALLTCTARVLDVMDENGVTVVILDQTVFQPQPASAQNSDAVKSDVGLIESEHNRFHVTRVERLEDRTRHVGTFEGEAFETDEEVTCTVNEEFQKEVEENKID